MSRPRIDRMTMPCPDCGTPMWLARAVLVTHVDGTAHVHARCLLHARRVVGPMPTGEQALLIAAGITQGVQSLPRRAAAGAEAAQAPAAPSGAGERPEPLPSAAARPWGDDVLDFMATLTTTPDPVALARTWETR